MRFLYVGLEPVTFDSEMYRQSVLLKFSGVRQLGNLVDYICYDQQKILSCVNGEISETSLTEKPSKEKQFDNYVLDFLKGQTYDFVYMRGLILNPAHLKIAKSVKTKKFGAKVIYEPRCYPEKEHIKEMLQDCREKSGVKEYAELQKKVLRHRLCLAGLANVVDTVVIYECPVNFVWGVPAIAVNNGIAVGQIKVRSTFEELGTPIKMLGIVDDTKINGYDRLFRGMNAYRHNRRREEISLDIVGSDEKTKELKKMAAKWNVEQFVNFVGEKTLPEINELCNTHTIAVSNLGLFRSGRIYDSPRMTRLFCAAGIPFLYAYEDVGLGVKVPFAMKIPNIDAPVSMELVGEFVWRCRLNTRLAQQERRFAEDNYDWRVIMKKILDFAATGKLEV